MTAETDQAQIRALFEKVRRGHHDRDPVAALAPYAPDAVIFDLAPPLYSATGTDPAELQKWFDTWEGPIEVDTKDLQIIVSADCAFCHGLRRISARTKAGGERAVFWMRATVCLVRQSGAWRVVHEHTSVPFYMDGSFRAAIDLEP